MLRDVSLDVVTYVHSHTRRISDIASHECRSKDIRQNTGHVKLLLNTVRHRVLETNPSDAVSRFLTGDEKLVP